MECIPDYCHARAAADSESESMQLHVIENMIFLASFSTQVTLCLLCASYVGHKRAWLFMANVGEKKIKEAKKEIMCPTNATCRAIMKKKKKKFQTHWLVTQARMHGTHASHLSSSMMPAQMHIGFLAGSVLTFWFQCQMSFVNNVLLEFMSHKSSKSKELLN